MIIKTPAEKITELVAKTAFKVIDNYMNASYAFPPTLFDSHGHPIGYIFPQMHVGDVIQVRKPKRFTPADGANP